MTDKERLDYLWKLCGQFVKKIKETKEKVEALESK